MGRLENFIPHLKPFKVQSGGGVNLLQFEDKDSMLIEEDVVPFIKQINGHLSLREIFLFLNEKGQRFSIDHSVAMLKHLAETGVMINGEDFDLVLHGKEKSVTHPKASRVDSSYFSRERLIGLIQKTTLFLKCDRSTAEQLLENAELQKWDPGQKIIEKGSKSSFFYVLLTGEVGVFRDHEILASLGPLSVFGESAAIFDRPRNADVKVTLPSWILKIDANKVVDTSSPDSFEAYKGLKSRLILNQTLAANPLFRTIPTDVLQFFISKCRIEKYGKEQIVVEQGTPGNEFFFILQGSVSVIKDGIPVTSLAEGDHFGEVAAMFKEPRTANVITELKSTFLVMNQQSFFEVLCSHFKLAIDIERTAKSRKNSKGNILQIFDDNYEQDVDTNVVHIADLEKTSFDIDADFLEVSQSNFELELVDFSKNPKTSAEDEDEIAS